MTPSHPLSRRTFLAGGLGALAATTLLPAMPALAAAGPDAALWLTQKSGSIYLAGKKWRGAGTNCYWLGLDDNKRDSQGLPTVPSSAVIDKTLTAARAMGLNLVRSHTLGISTGSPQSIMPTLGQVNAAAFTPIDRAISTARAQGLRLILPLTDQWRYYHGGKWNFVHWRAGQNGITDTLSDLSQNCANNNAEKVAEAQFYTNETIIADFENYIKVLLTHKNTLTNLTLAQDPTVAIIETGNEMWDAPIAWTQRIAAYIKSLAPKVLVSDGSAAGGLAVSSAVGLKCSAVDIVGSHYYPRNAAQLTSDITAAQHGGKAYGMGEYDWTSAHAGPTLAAWQTQLEQSSAAYDCFWALIPYDDAGVPEPHSDGYQFWSPVPASGNPVSQAASQAALQQMEKHAKTMLTGVLR